MNKLKFFIERFRWLKVLNSPFKPFKVSMYVGKTQVGVPYFYPRKWVKGNNRMIPVSSQDAGNILITQLNR